MYLLAAHGLGLAFLCALLVTHQFTHAALEGRLQPDLLVAEVTVRRRLEVRANKVVLAGLQRPENDAHSYCGIKVNTRRLFHIIGLKGLIGDL